MRKAVPLVPVLLSLLLVSGCARFRKPVDPEAAYRPLPPQIAEQIQPDRPFDHRPYEFILNERDQAHGPTVDFELLMGWTVTSEGAENAVLERSYERQLWGPHVGKVAWIGARDQISLTLRPPEALRVPDYFDTVTLWVRGGPGISDDPGAGSQLGVTVLIRGADGRSTPISLPTAETGGWTLLQHRLSEEERQRILHPCVIEGIKVEVHNAAEADSVFMDSLALYADRSPVLRFSPRPRPLTEMPFEENHTGKNPAKYLSFPVRKETIIPIRSSTESYTMLRQGDSGLYEFSCVAPDGDIRYWFNPDAGLSELTAEWNGKQVGKLLSGAGPLPVCPAGKTVLSRIEGESLRVEYDDGLSLRLSMEGKWLVIDIAGRSEKFSGFNFGKVQGLADARFVAMPSLSTRGGASGVLMGKSSASKAEHLFVGIWPDWTRSNGSELALRGDTEDTGENGSVRYLARTDGRRNRLSERLIVAVSPDALDVLPAIPNPRGMKAEMLSSRLWMQAHSADSYQEEVKRARELAAYGITNVIYNPGDWTWRDSGESRSLRTRAAPGKGGDAALAAFIADLQSLGWSVALSQNYKGLSPLNVRWNEDDVELDESGQWRGSSPGHYVLKAQRAIEWQRELLPEIRKKYGPDASFVGSRTLSPLWEAVDCDARVPQSGILSQNYYLYGELFLRERAGVDGPVVGGGAGAWPFAGLLDGYIAPSETSPFMVLHELNGIHSMACVIGAGERMDDQDRYLAIEIANGRCGMLWGEAGVRAALRGYYMMQALQCLYALKTPEQISYFDGSRLLPVSQAIAVGASRKNMLYVRYPGDIEIWVNGSTDRMWDVKVGRRTWDIPPSGWVASGPNFIELSCITDGARIDYVESPGYVYFDPRGIESEFRGLRTAAPLVVRRGKRGGGEYEVTTTPDSTGFSIDREWLPAGNVRCRTFDVEGVEVSPSVLEVDSEWIKVTPTRGGIRHILDMGGGDS